MNDLYEEKSVKTILIDGNDHVSGRLASVVASLLIRGQFVAVVNCVGIIRSGSMTRNVGVWESWMNKTCRANPKFGPKHHREPRGLFFRTVRGMIPRKIWKGLAALRRLRVYNGVPPCFFYKKKSYVPSAHASLRLKTETKRVSLGDLCEQIGWTQYPIVKKFEEERKENEKKLKEHREKIEEVYAKTEKELLEKNSEFQKICQEIEKLELF